jgi:hypothetical protein
MFKDQKRGEWYKIGQGRYLLQDGAKEGAIQRLVHKSGNYFLYRVQAVVWKNEPGWDGEDTLTRFVVQGADYKTQKEALSAGLRWITEEWDIIKYEFKDRHEDGRVVRNKEERMYGAYVPYHWAK